MFLALLQLIVMAVILLSALWLLSHLANWMQQRAITNDLATADLNLFKAKIDLILERKSEVAQVNELAWNSFRKFEVVRKEMETPDVCSIYLKPHDRRPLPIYKPGQFLTFKLDIPSQKKAIIRCYSLSDSAFNTDSYRLTIKRVPPPRDQPEVPPGLSSNYFHDQVNESDIIDVKAPSGAFFFDLTRPHPAVLIGGGIGLTPVLSMITSMVDSGYNHETWFFYGVRNGVEHAMKAHLQKLNEEHNWLHINVCYSAPSSEDIKGQSYDHDGRVGVALFKELLPSNNYDFYMCGPPPMMNTVVNDLEEWGVPESRIHFEAFGPASIKKVNEAQADGDHAADSSETAFSVKFAKSGKQVEWSANFDSLLDLAEENDITMDFGCRAGNCGTCITALKAGSVELIQNSVGAADCEKGSCLACISIPKTNLVLDA